MKKNVMILWFIVCLVLCLEKITGPVIHSIIGLIVCVGGIFHFNKLSTRLKVLNKSYSSVDWALLVIAILLMISGILVAHMDVVVFKIMHSCLGLLFVILSIVHVNMHKSY